MSADKIVVGYDATPGAEHALSWALAEAGRRRASVELVYALAMSSYAPVVSVAPGAAVWPTGEIERAVRESLADAVAGARRAAPDVPVTGVIERGAAAPVLQDRSRSAALLVVGGHSHRAVADLVLGSVAGATAAHAFCSVVVVRDPGPPDDDRPVVLGLDGGLLVQATIGFAFEYAAAHGAALRAVHAWIPPADPWIGSQFVDREEIAVAEQVWARDLLAGWDAKYPSVRIVVESVIGHPYRVLTDAARDARLTVVGARGRGGFRDLRLGSVTRYLLHHGTGTVAVVR